MKILTMVHFDTKKNITFYLILPLMLVLSLSSCEENKAIQPPERTLILGHRGIGIHENDGHIENTISAVREGFRYSDGVEIDIQMSASKTLWLYHDGLFTNLCDSSQILLQDSPYKCILQTPDSIIEQLRFCRNDVEDKLTSLSDFFKELAKDKNKKKMVSIDVKGYFDSSCVQKNNVDETYQIELANELYQLAKQYNIKDQIVVETNYTTVFKRLKELDPTIQCYYLVAKNGGEMIDYAIEIESDGLSLNLADSTLNIEQIKRARERGLKIEFWTIRREEDLQEVMKYKPHAIEVSNFELLKSIYHSDTLDIK